jgi:uncharacterized protein (TIGR03382 family)
MSKRSRSLAIVCLLALAACSRDEELHVEPLRDPAQVQVLEANTGELRAIAQVHPRRVLFGGVIEVEVELRAPSSYLELAWEQGAHAGHLQLLDLALLENRTQGAEQTKRWRARFEAPRSGRALGRLAPLRAKPSAEAATLAVELPTFAIEVDPPSEGSAPRFEELAGPLPGIAIPPERSYAAWIGVGAGGAAALGLLLFWWRRRRRRALAVPPPDPREEARAALQALRGSGLVEGELFGELYYRLTMIVRTYLERATGLRAPERTTEEFLREIEEHPAYPAAAKQELRAFLSAADPVKYAAQRPDAQSIEHSLVAAQHLIDTIHAQEASAR